MATRSATLPQMLKHPWVLGVFSRLKPAGLALQNFYGMGPTAAPTERPTGVREFAYDIFNNTRTMASLRAPMTGPSRIAPKPIGRATAYCARLYETIPFPYEKVYGTRPLGGQLGALDRTGKSWVARQMKYGAQRFANSIEFMVSRMFRGGYSITISGEDLRFGELGAGTVDVSFPIPAVNKSQLDAGTGSDIIGTTWSNAAATIVEDMYTLNAAAELQTGYPIEHCWCNTTTFLYILGNTQLRTIHGTYGRVFEEFRQQVVQSTDEQRRIGFTVRFPAMPQFLWHVYDATSVVSSAVDPATNTTSNNSKYIPDNVVVFTPEPAMGDWHGVATASEPIRKQGDVGPVTIADGLTSWSMPTGDPAPGEELRMLLNFTPLLYVPSAIYYGTVVF